MSTPIGIIVAAALLLGAWRVDFWSRALVADMERAAALRQALLVEPRHAVALACQEPPSPLARCRVRLRWRTAGEHYAEICEQGPPLASDPRFRAARYYELSLDCPAFIPRLGRYVLRTRLLR